MNTLTRYLLLLQLTRENGVSLLMAILVGLILSSIGYVTIHAVITDGNISRNHVHTVQAFWIAEAGMEKTLRYLRFADPPPGGTARFTHEDGTQVGGGTYSVDIDPDDNNAGTYLKRYKIIVTAEVGDVTKTLQATVQTCTFGKYAYLTGSEGGTIWFTSSDLIEGPIHSNDRISITGRPTFMGKVTSSASSFNQGAGYNPDFQKGYQLGIPQVAFPTLQNILDNYLLENGSTTPLTIDARFSRDARITFNANGTMTYSVWQSSWGGGITYIVNNQVVDLGTLNGLIYVLGDVEVSGTINGQVTLIATDNIKITNDLVYSDAAASGEPDPNSSNLLGLVSVKNLIVADNAANRNDVRIDAAILALGTSFTVQNYSSGSPRGDLTIYGSLSQKVRGPVGTFNRWGTSTGYNKDYHYDDRFSSTPPPYFPITGQYDVFSWQEVDE